jgi:hypothetical protein
MLNRYTYASGIVLVYGVALNQQMILLGTPAGTFSALEMLSSVTMRNTRDFRRRILLGEGEN